MTRKPKISRGLVAAASALCLALAAAPAAGQCQGHSTDPGCQWTLTEYTTESGFFGAAGSTKGITVGPDSNVYFVQPNSAHHVGRVTTGGQVSYPLTNPTFSGIAPTVQTPSGPITSVTGGALWMTYGQTLVQRPTDGAPVNHNLPGFVAPPASSPFHQIDSIGWDGAGSIWFTDFYNSQRKLTRYVIANDSFQEMTPPTECQGGAPITRALDGSLWFPGHNAACRIRPDSSITSVPLPSTTSGSDGIAVGPDGRIWLTLYTGSAALAAFNPANCQDSSCVTVYPNLPSPAHHPHGLTSGPDGRMWFVSENPDLVGSVKIDGSDFQWLLLPANGSVPTRMTAGPTGDNSIWFTESNAGRIGRVTGLTAAPQTALYLQGGRFKVEVDWSVPPQGTSGSGSPVPIASDTGAFWFFSQNNLENMIKVLDGRSINGKWWLFYGAISNVDYTIKSTDLVTGVVKNYHNPYGTLGSNADTSAFADYAPPPTESKESTYEVPPTGSSFDPADLVKAELASARMSAREREAACTPDAQSLCLAASRFKVQVAWRVPSQGTSGVGTASALTSDTGDFWFFSSNNLELIIKVLDGRAINNHFWVFYGALSNVEYTITITDTLTGTIKNYVNPNGNLASVADTNAF